MPKVNVIGVQLLSSFDSDEFKNNTKRVVPVKVSNNFDFTVNQNNYTGATQTQWQQTDW